MPTEVVLKYINVDGHRAIVELLHAIHKQAERDATGASSYPYPTPHDQSCAAAYLEWERRELAEVLRVGWRP